MYKITSIKQHYFKFVVGDNSQIENVNKFVEEYNIDKSKVYLMPLTTYDKIKDDKIKNVVVGLAIEYGYNYSLRLHIDLWGKKRGV